MGEFAPPITQAYLAENTRLFFDVYLQGDSFVAGMPPCVAILIAMGRRSLDRPSA